MGRTRRARRELVALGSVGLAHVVLELVFGESIALAFTGAAVVGALLYLVQRWARDRSVLVEWGLRLDNLAPGLRLHLGFALAAALPLLAVGAALDRLAVPWTFWLTLCLYPLWGFAQQFALQNLVAENLRALRGGPALVLGVTASVFGLSHVPRFDLVLLTLVSGLAFTWLYARVRNLWALGLAHGILGTCAIFFVVGEDPLAVALVRMGWIA